jgi:hypothetical protein
VDILIVTAGVAIYPFPRTKSSASVGERPKGWKDREKPGFSVIFQAKASQYWKLGKESVE